MKSICSASLLLIIFSLSFAVFSPLPVAGEKYPQNTNDIYQGDLILSGNTNHTIIGETFHINGSIIITENATLYLRDATLNFTLKTVWQFNITLRDPVNGQPRLTVYNSTIVCGWGMQMKISVRDNGTALLVDTVGGRIELGGHETATLNVSGTDLIGVHPRSTGVVADILNSTVDYVAAERGTISIRNSTVSLRPMPTDVNSTIVGLEPGFVDYWDYEENCSVIGELFPRFTVNRTTVTDWSFRFFGSSNLTLQRSSLGEMTLWGSSSLTSYDSSMGDLNLLGETTAKLVNSTTTSPSVSDQGRVWFHWYVDTHVIDQIDQDVPMAIVIAKFANDTQADTALTDDSGWARLTLLEKMVNATSSYPEEPYTVTATYGAYINEDTVEMTENKELTISLPFMIPELPLAALAVIAMSILILTVLLLKRRV